MRSLSQWLILSLLVLGLGASAVHARAGRPNADCPAGSKDPDCQ